MNRPSFATTVTALRTTDTRFPWVGPTPDEDDVAAALEVVEFIHQGENDEPDERGSWGHCRSCRTWWPCDPWIEAENLAVQYLGRATDRVVAHARAVAQTAHPVHQEATP